MEIEGKTALLDDDEGKDIELQTTNNNNNNIICVNDDEKLDEFFKENELSSDLKNILINNNITLDILINMKHNDILKIGMENMINSETLGNNDNNNNNDSETLMGFIDDKYKLIKFVDDYKNNIDSHVSNSIPDINALNTNENKERSDIISKNNNNDNSQIICCDNTLIKSIYNDFKLGKHNLVLILLKLIILITILFAVLPEFSPEHSNPVRMHVQINYIWNTTDWRPSMTYAFRPAKKYKRITISPRYVEGVLITYDYHTRTTTSHLYEIHFVTWFYLQIFVCGGIMILLSIIRIKCYYNVSLNIAVSNGIMLIICFCIYMLYHVIFNIIVAGLLIPFDTAIFKLTL